MTIHLTDNVHHSDAQPRLSVLIPFLRDDPADLIQRLDREAGSLGNRVEVVLLDDGTGDDDLTHRLTAILTAAVLPIRLITLTANQGRAAGRNLLASHARGQGLLFLDSDMRPDRPDFLQAWLAFVDAGQTPIAFGGFSLLQAPQDRQLAIHRQMAARSECLSAEQRQLQPEKYVFTSNLLIDRNIFQQHAFDASFTGWGWEDVEWAMRVSRLYPVAHVDNPATHMGLDRVEDLARKYEQSAPNFARVLARHPDFVTAYPSYRAARLLRHLPGRGLLRAGLRQGFRSAVLPVRLRAFSLRLYRAALYAEVV
ncbi:glycosyltransferase family 2 protein [Brevundimonas vesicularis]|uniref:glycosyltransferase family 2 protein n=1 Tax=Brevundimonas vesicularis TaxID=41276 RepID=UPI0038D4A999